MLTVARLIAALVAVCTAAPASAQDFTSQYTSTNVKKCKQVDRAKEGEGDWSVWLCAGIGGYVVRQTEDDLRMTISIGRTLEGAANEPAAKHQFAPFNNVNDTLEWRSFRGQPFATIQRWFLSDMAKATATGNPPQAAMLIVTRLDPACHVAYVDVGANGANANVLARQAADEHARKFECKGHPIVIGKSGRAIELSRP